MRRRDPGPGARIGQPVHHRSAQAVRAREISPGEVQLEDRAPHGPVPPVVDGEAPEELLAPPEELGDRVQQEALAEAARAGQEVAISPADQALDVRRLVHVAAPVLAQPAKGLDSDREPPARRIAVTWAGHAASEDGDALRVRQRTHDRRRVRCPPATKPLRTKPRPQEGTFLYSAPTPDISTLAGHPRVSVALAATRRAAYHGGWNSSLYSEQAPCRVTCRIQQPVKRLGR